VHTRLPERASTKLRDLPSGPPPRTRDGQASGAAGRRVLRWLIALACHYSGLDGLYRQLRGPALCILMFHRLRDDPDPYPLSITPASFRRLLGWLRAGGRLVDLDGGLARLTCDRRGTHYALTFDDGYRDNLALLDDTGATLPAVLYLATGHVGGQPIWAYRLANAVAARRIDVLDLADLGLQRWALGDAAAAAQFLAEVGAALKRLPSDRLEQCLECICARLDPEPDPRAARDMLDWVEARQLYAAGIAIGAHTVHHAILSRMGDAAARAEIVQSRDAIAEAIAPPRHFSYPNGEARDFGQRDVDLVRTAGFATAVTTIEGVNRPGTDPYRLRRFNVHEARFLSPFGAFSRALFFSETSGLLDWLRTRALR
jgi:peptidoglycan/xylan/chitin deacetylase (PgdA/CDA1 family)